MSKPKEIEVEVLPPGTLSLPELAQRIRTHHKGVIEGFQSQVMSAFLCGVELNAAKALIHHGNRHANGEDFVKNGFIKWREKEFPTISHGCAANWMNLAKGMQEKFPTVGNFVPRLLATNGEPMSEGEEEAVMKGIHEVLDGKTITEWYRELDILRKPKHQSERARGKPMTPEEKARAQEQEADDLAITTLGDVSLVTEDLVRGRLTAARKNELRDAFIEAGKKLAADLKQERKSKRAKSKERGLQPASTHRSPK